MSDIVDGDLSQLWSLRFGSAAEWRSVCTGDHNVLLEGPAASTGAVLLLLKQHFVGPVTWKHARAPLELPAGASGVLVLEDIAALDREEQARLLAWLDGASHRRRVISAAAHPLFYMVVRGLFDEVLYYRLNVMLLHLSEFWDAWLSRPSDQRGLPVSSGSQLMNGAHWSSQGRPYGADRVSA